MECIYSVEDLPSVHFMYQSYVLRCHVRITVSCVRVSLSLAQMNLLAYFEDVTDTFDGSR